MSCRSTRAGTASLRLARRETGLSDKEVTSLFHALKREGQNCGEPTLSEFNKWKAELAQGLEHSDRAEHQKARTEYDLAAIEDEDYDGPTFYALSMIVKRARQEAVLQAMRENAADIKEPGSQSNQYELDENGVPKRVWYASYGSNINSDRFYTYLTGEEYRGSLANSGGAREKELPDDETGVLLPGRLLFAARASRWGGGGIAFLDVDDEYSFSAGKAYSISWRQFEDVLAQESGGAAGTKKVSWEELNELRDIESGGLYGRVIHVGDYAGRPVITFTGSYSAAEIAEDYKHDNAPRYRTVNKPHGNYIRTIGEGLEQTFNLNTSQQADYFAGSLGGHFKTSAETEEILNSEYEVITQTPKRPKSNHRTSLSERVRYEPTYESRSRNYTPWWEDPDDPVNQRAARNSSTRDDEIPDWWWDVDSEEDMYEYESQLFADLKDSYESPTPFATPHKRCVICHEQSHDMHNCPWL